MLAATSTYAGEAELSLESRIGGDSNVLRESEFPKSEVRRGRGSEDGYWELAPRLILREGKEPLTYEASFRGVRQQFFNKNRLTGWDHASSLRSTWRATPVDTLTVFGAHENERRLRFLPDLISGANPGDPDRLVTRESNRLRIRTSRALLSYSRALSPNRSVAVSYSFDDVDFVPNSNPGANAIDTRAHTVSVAPDFALSSLTSVGFGVTGRVRENAGIRNLGQSSSDVVTGDFSLRLSRTLSPTSVISLSAGPSVINTNIHSATGTKDETTDISWFASARYARRWARADLTLSYSRFESASGGAGATSIVDQVSAALRWRPEEQVSFGLSLSWSEREQLVTNSPALVIPDSKLTVVRVLGDVRYQITERVSVLGRFQYRYQFDVLEALQNRGFEVFTGFVAFRYTFEPLTY